MASKYEEEFNFPSYKKKMQIKTLKFHITTVRMAISS
jgi:hypothetical protein